MSAAPRTDLVAVPRRFLGDFIKAVRYSGHGQPTLDRAMCELLLAEVNKLVEQEPLALQEHYDKLAAEVSRLQDLINTPALEAFDKAVPLECAHQVERWGEAHDRSKSAENWYWLVGYLAGKALRANIIGDRAKALHHTISAAAALRNWHRAIQQDTTGAGVGQDEDLEANASL